MTKNELSIREVAGGGYGDFWNTKKRYVAIKGSRGSKKSKTAALWIIVNMIMYPHSNILCVRRYQNTIRDSQYSDLKWAVSKLGLEPFFDFKISPLEVTYKPTGQKILFRGLDDGLKVTSISVSKGVLCWVWIEEAFELESEDDFNKLDMSIRGVMPEGYFKRIMLTFNPWSANCWIKKRFFDNTDENTFIKTTTWECNEWLDDADRRLFELMRQNYPKRYLIEGAGEWGISEGLIYDRVKMGDFDANTMRQNTTAAFGLDFGYTDPNAFIAALVDNANMKIYIFDEFYKTGITNKQIAQEIKNKGYARERITCDSAEPKSIAELQEEGINAEGSRKGRDSVLHGIKLIQNYEIIVHPRCVNFYREITNYTWEKDRNGQPTDKPDHEFSHGMDALRYGVCKVLLGSQFSFD